MDFLALFLNKEDHDPLYYQLYSHLANDIRSGKLPAGERLPGKRTAAQQLGVSINTVDTAYQMLAAEGYVTALPRSGFIVAPLQQQLVPMPDAALYTQPGGTHTSPGFEHRQSWRFSFSTSGLDEDLFPRKIWSRLLREVLAEEGGLFGRGEANGDEVLREAITSYLRSYRGVRCEASQLVIGAGLEVLIGMLARLFDGSAFALEDPGYLKTLHIIRNMGLRTLAIPLDGQGMRPGLLAQSGAQLAYLTPSHQFPTGGVMPAGRRAELLNWASGGEHYIIEDDYDSEFRFDGRPLPCMQGLDKAGRVVYAGTFSRSLAPGLRAAYLVLPPALLHRWKAVYGDYACTVGRPEQHTLARLITGGYFARSLNRARSAYRKRRDTLLDALKETLTCAWQVENTHTGLYFILRIPGHSATSLAKQARENGIRLYALDEYRLAEPTPTSPTAGALVVGYGGLKPDQIDPAVQTLAAILG